MTQRDSEGLGGTRRDSEGLGWARRDSDRLGGTRRDSDTEHRLGMTRKRAQTRMHRTREGAGPERLGRTTAAGWIQRTDGENFRISECNIYIYIQRERERERERE